MRNATIAPTSASRCALGACAKRPRRVARALEALHQRVEHRARLDGIVDRSRACRARGPPRSSTSARPSRARRTTTATRRRAARGRSRCDSRAAPRCAVRIGAREMADQRAVRLAVRHEQQRQVRHERLGIAGRDQRRERMVVHQPRDRGAVVRRRKRRACRGSSSSSVPRGRPVRQCRVRGGPSNSARAAAGSKRYASPQYSHVTSTPPRSASAASTSSAAGDAQRVLGALREHGRRSAPAARGTRAGRRAGRARCSSVVRVAVARARRPRRLGEARGGAPSTCSSSAASTPGSRCTSSAVRGAVVEAQQQAALRAARTSRDSARSSAAIDAPSSATMPW